jgi:hypothetical protein
MISKEDMKLLIEYVGVPLEVLIASDKETPIKDIGPNLRYVLYKAAKTLRKLEEETEKNFKESINESVKFEL